MQAFPRAWFRHYPGFRQAGRPFRQLSPPLRSSPPVSCRLSVFHRFYSADGLTTSSAFSQDAFVERLTNKDNSSGYFLRSLPSLTFSPLFLSHVTEIFLVGTCHVDEVSAQKVQEVVFVARDASFRFIPS